MSKSPKEGSQEKWQEFSVLNQGAQKLWAPWRLDYILDPNRLAKNSDPKSCVFCQRQNAPDDPQSDRQNLILYRGRTCYTLMNKFPYNNGHLMVIPFEHIGDFTKFSKELAQEMILELQRSCEILQEVLHSQGYNIGMNLGSAAGAGIPNHAHFHVVPRWEGDTNFMPVIGDTRVMPEYIEKTYDRLMKAFQK